MNGKSQNYYIHPALNSAVAAYTDAQATQNWHIVVKDTGNKKKTTIQSLPPELLLIIFKLVHDAVLVSERDGVVWGEEWYTGDPLSPYLFPYTIAAVCPRWREVSSMVPEFWTRVVILVDAPPTLPAEIECQLAWSRDLPIDITVTRRGPRHTVDNPHEKAWIEIAMSLIRPHLWRCASLRFNAKWSSSLPAFPDEFPAPAENLKRLELQCSEDDEGFAGQTSIAPTENVECRFPALVRLVIDGRNYYRACRRSIEWTWMLPRLISLAVTQFKPGPEDSFTVREMMLPLVWMHLDSLRISDIGLAPPPRTPTPPCTPNPPPPHDSLDHLSFLQLEDLSVAGRIKEIVGFFSTVHEMTMTRCVTDELPNLLSYDAELRLDDISVQYDVLRVLRSWRGKQLEVSGCAGFNDTVLVMMGARNGENGRFICARHTRRLRITDCGCFTIAALKHLVAVRLKAPGGDDEDDETLPVFPHTTRFKEIYVSGDVPRLSAEDRSWFDENVPDFRYQSNDDEY